MKIKHTGQDFVISHAVGEETGGSAAIAPGQVLDLSPELAVALAESSQTFKLLKEKESKSKTEVDN